MVEASVEAVGVLASLHPEILMNKSEMIKKEKDFIIVYL